MKKRPQHRSYKMPEAKKNQNFHWKTKSTTKINNDFHWKTVLDDKKT